jgi:hypothetical protein
MQSYLNNTDTEKNNAVRHAWWNTMMARDYGE